MMVRFCHLSRQHYLMIPLHPELSFHNKLPLAYKLLYQQKIGETKKGDGHVSPFTSTLSQHHHVTLYEFITFLKLRRLLIKERSTRQPIVRKWSNFR